MTVSGEGQWLRPPSSTPGSAFSGALMYGLIQGGVLSPADSVPFGTTGAWPAVVTVYDTDSYWDGTTHFVIPTTGYYRVFFGVICSFTSGAKGALDDYLRAYLTFSSFHPGIQANWQPSVYQINDVRGSHYTEDHWTAAETVELRLENDNGGSTDATFDVVTFGISRSG